MQDKTLLEKIEALEQAERVTVRRSGLRKPNDIMRPIVRVVFNDRQRQHLENWFYQLPDGKLLFERTYNTVTGQNNSNLRRRLCVQEMIEHAYARWCVEPKFDK